MTKAGTVVGKELSLYKFKRKSCKLIFLHRTITEERR